MLFSCYLLIKLIIQRMIPKNSQKAVFGQNKTNNASQFQNKQGSQDVDIFWNQFGKIARGAKIFGNGSASPLMTDN